MAGPKILTPANLLTHSQPFVDNANNLTEQAERAEVVDAESFANATDFVKVCSAQFNAAEEARKAITGPLNDHIGWINDQFRPITTALKAAKDKVSVKAAAWKQAEDKRIREEEEAARLVAEEEALAAAEAAAEAGDEEKAEALLDVAADTPAGPTKAPVARGQLTGATGSTKTNWKGEVKFDDIQEVCQAIADGKLPSNIIKEWAKKPMNDLAKQIGSEWPEDKNEGKHYGLTIKRDVALSVR